MRVVRGNWVSGLMLVLAGGSWGSGPVVELAPYLVEAWHFDGLALEVPAGVVRLEAVDIAGSGAASVPELLERAAGVRMRGVTGSGLEGQPALRGFGDNSGMRVLVLMDGQVYNNPDMSGLTWSGVELAELSSVEVLRGGQTVLYGNHAVSGVIKLETRQPGAELEGWISGGAGETGEQRAGFGLGRRVGPAGLRGGLSIFESDGYRENAATRGGTANMSWRVDGTNGTAWDGRIRQARVRMEFPGPLTYEQMLENPRQSTNGGEAFSDTDEWQATMRGEGTADWGRWQLVGGALLRERWWQMAGRQAANRQQRVTLNPRVRWQTGKGFMVAGADLAWDGLDYKDYVDVAGTVTRAWADIGRLTAGGYGFYSRQLAPGWDLSGGVRFEHAGSSNQYIHYREEQLLAELETNRGPIPNPNYRDPPEVDAGKSYDGRIGKSGWAAEVSLVRKLGQGLSFWTGWDRVYRYPALDETASYQGYPLSNPLNAELEPETGNNFEAGIKRVAGNWQAGATVFLLRMRDEIAFDADARINRNIGDSERRGVELDGSYQESRYGVSGRVSLIEAHLRGRDDLLLPLVPELEAGLAAWWRPVANLRLQGNWRYYASQVQGNDYANMDRRIPACELVDFTAAWEPFAGLSIQVALNNVFDKTHATTAYSGGFYPGAGRQVHLRTTYAF